MAEKLTHGEFQDHLNTQFLLQLEGSDSLELQLTEVSELKTNARQEIFSIVFRGPANNILPQRTYQLAHENMGRLDLFLVPVRKDNEGIYYEAVFNRLLKNH